MSYALIEHDVIQLSCAIRTGDISDVKILLQAAIDVNCQDRNGETALHTAVWTDCEDAVQELIDSCADVNQSNQNGQTPLHMAARCGNADIVKLLLEADADTEAKTKYTEMTALHIASQNGHTDIVRLLLDHDVDIDTLDVINKTAAFYAGNSEIARMLRENELTRQGRSGERGIQNQATTFGTVQKKTEPVKAPIHHKLTFSPEHKKIMRMNVFARLTRKKPQAKKTEPE